MQTPESYDLIVIGGGRAASLAIAASKAGQKTALVERDKLGGACPNRGCVPSKLLIGFAEAARHVRKADRHFIDAQLRNIDAAKVFESVNDYVDECILAAAVKAVGMVRRANEEGK